MKYFRMAYGLAGFLALAALAPLTQAEEERPARVDAALVVLEAKVAAIDHETRQVTLEDSEGQKVAIRAADDVQNLDQVQAGDTVEVEYFEMVAMEVMPKDATEITPTATGAKMTAAPGEKPADAVLQETRFVMTVKAINKEKETVTLEGPAGETKTVKARDPANLDKIVVGDKVLVTHTVAIAVVVTEK